MLKLICQQLILGYGEMQNGFKATANIAVFKLCFVHGRGRSCNALLRLCKPGQVKFI